MTIAVLIGIIVSLCFALARAQWEIEKLKREKRARVSARP